MEVAEQPLAASLASATGPQEHLSELCKAGLDAVLRKLRTHAEADEAALNWQDEEGRTAFHWAVGLKLWDLASRLMAEPLSCATCTVDSDGTTTLMTACASGAPDTILDPIIRGFVESGAVETADSSGNTALLLAASRGNLSALKKLIAAGANISAQNKRGQTALHRAVSRGMSDSVEELLAASKKLERTARIRLLNAVDVEGNTALHYAAMENNQELGQLLLRAGASRDIANKAGKLFYEV